MEKIYSNGLTYRDNVLRTANFTIKLDSEATSSLVAAGLGLAGEAGEVVDMIKKDVFHGSFISKEKYKKEIGDLLWYAEVLMHLLRLTEEEVKQANIDKLQARYPNGFSVEAANAPRKEE